MNVARALQPWVTYGVHHSLEFTRKAHFNILKACAFDPCPSLWIDGKASMNFEPETLSKQQGSGLQLGVGP